MHIVEGTEDITGLALENSPRAWVPVPSFFNALFKRQAKGDFQDPRGVSEAATSLFLDVPFLHPRGWFRRSPNSQWDQKHLRHSRFPLRHPSVADRRTIHDGVAFLLQPSAGGARIGPGAIHVSPGSLKNAQPRAQGASSIRQRLHARLRPNVIHGGSPGIRGLALAATRSGKLIMRPPPCFRIAVAAACETGMTRADRRRAGDPSPRRATVERLRHVQRRHLDQVVEPTRPCAWWRRRRSSTPLRP